MNDQPMSEDYEMAVNFDADAWAKESDLVRVPYPEIPPPRISIDELLLTALESVLPIKINP